MIEYTVKVYANGTEWWLDDKLHRQDGPAIQYSNGTKKWFIEDKLHREDGPAIEYYDGTEYFYLHGILYTQEEFNARTNSCDGKTVEIDGVTYRLNKV